MPRLACLGESFLRQQLLALQLRNPFLIGGHDRVVAGLDNAVEQLVDLLFDILHGRFHRARRMGSLGKPHVPRVPEHGPHKSEHGF
ncbi:hypothetical protein L1787_05480 [Acuticoccus sp. M5D2P5]|uniref:hypothetical protein n=1 Tax=Acuticoccus kalidii TaxID=2910977 RepID=UPI001F2A6CE4|nr:hypothetical protein [Acuticoccus kalidii]MCF3932865.1 hypothetical protein [Acuticoccus kalidii]